MLDKSEHSNQCLQDLTDLVEQLLHTTPQKSLLHEPLILPVLFPCYISPLQYLASAFTAGKDRAAESQAPLLNAVT